MAKIQVLLKKKMNDSCLHFIPGVSNPDQGNVSHLNCISHLNYRLRKTQHLRLHLIDVIWLFLVICYINKYVVLPFTNLLPIDLSGSVSLNPSFTEGNVTCILPSQSEAVHFYRFHIISLCLLCFHSKYNLS